MTSSPNSPKENSPVSQGNVTPTNENESLNVELSFPVLDYVNEIRFKHGIKLEEYNRYHNFCSRKLHNLRKQLKPLPTKSNKYVHEEFPVPLNDNRYLEILTVRCERSWSHGMDLKSKCETSTMNNNRGRHYYMRKFGKAYRLSVLLLEYSQKYANNRTVNNAKVYKNFMQGVLKYEQEKFEEAHQCLSAYSSVMEQKLRATSGYKSSEGYASQLSQLNALVKMCTFHMKVIGKKISTTQLSQHEDSNAQLIMVRKTEENNYVVHCRGVAVPLESQLLPQKILDALDSIDKLHLTETLLSSFNGPEDLSKKLNDEVTSKFTKQELLNNYDEVTSLFNGCSEDVYSELMSNMENQDQVRKLEDSLRIMKSLLEVEKHLVLLTLTLNELLCEGKEPLPNSSEGMRYANILKQHLASLIEDTTLGTSFLVPNEVLRTVNALLLSIHSFRKGDLKEGMALVHWSNSRSMMNFEIPERQKNRLLWRCIVSFGNLQSMCSLVSSRYYQRLFALFAREKESKELKEDEDVMDIFNIEKNLVFCRPLLFDLAFIYYEPPDLHTGTRFKGKLEELIRSIRSKKHTFITVELRG
ncbi:signal recognition particle subunit [Theileria orientalis]|uniref:Signal recognition particle subunit SRP68 n=1 Tax=Theileria orientalis TaxID=68886 RepID=A0A976MEH2_THEOR|nr:signal recognition particle subunit [Theileria orientalis]